MTRPTAHAEDCCFEDGPSDLFCTCALAEKQRIFDLERRVAEARELAYQSAKLPYYIGGGRDAGEHWREALEEVVSLLAAANEAEG